MRFETLVVRAGHSPDAITGAVVPPIHFSTPFEVTEGTFCIP